MENQEKLEVYNRENGDFWVKKWHFSAEYPQKNSKNKENYEIYSGTLAL